MTFDISKSLTEKSLGEKLREIFGREFIHNRHFIDRRRPDYRDVDLKLLVEYDGPNHFTSARRMVNDRERDEFYLGYGYRTIRIPMFVQLYSDTIFDIFGIKTGIIKEYPNGFISDMNTMVLPCDFCELGIESFKTYLDRIPSIREDVIWSLKRKIELLGNIDRVLPPSLRYLVE